tara:strand:+ start:855 stop:1355 length:501 start_codon:yes stop_codon:yes gene_type:complete
MANNKLNMQVNKKKFIYIFIFFFIFFLDRISKIIVINKTEKIVDNTIFESSFINLELIWNKGIAFGLFSFSSSNIYNYVTVVVLFVILMVVYFFMKTKNMEKIFFLMILAGAVGNFYDRIAYRGVPDFIDLHVNNFHWFIFNIADIFITLGVICLIIKETLIKNDD